MGKSTISMAIFNSYVSHYQAGYDFQNYLQLSISPGLWSTYTKLTYPDILGASHLNGCQWLEKNPLKSRVGWIRSAGCFLLKDRDDSPLIMG